MIKSTIRMMVTFFFLSSSFLAQAQSRVINGKVTDKENGQGIPGVNVLVKGTTTGTTTDTSGDFKLTASTDDLLVFSFIGYETIEVPVGAQTSLSVSLGTDTKALEEVVVVGYGTQRKIDLTGSVGSLRA